MALKLRIPFHFLSTLKGQILRRIPVEIDSSKKVERQIDGNGPKR